MVSTMFMSVLPVCGKEAVFKAFSQIYNPCWLQFRNTFILKRRYPPIVHKVGRLPRKLRHRHYVYQLVEDTNIRRQEDLELVLLDYVEGIGLKGDVVKVRPNVGRFKLILPGLAAYATPENLAKYQKDNQADTGSQEHSSIYAGMTAKFLARSIPLIVMNLHTPWTIEKWHVRVALRKAGVVVPDYAITLPEKEISGPNIDLEGKIFLVTIKINSCETAMVRCRIHHWTRDLSKTLPVLKSYWLSLEEPVFPETLETLKSLPLPPPQRQNTTVTR